MTSSTDAYKKFVKQLILLSAILGLLSFGFYLFLPGVTPAMPFILLLIMSVTMLMHRSLLKNSTGKPNRFINLFLAFTGLKLVGYLLIITIYALLNKDDAVSFTITFLIYYLIYSAFEINDLIRFLKKPE